MAEENKKSAPRWEEFLARWGKIAGYIVAILGLLFLLFPKIKPGLPPDAAAKITSITMESDVSYEVWLQRQNLQAPQDFTCAETKSHGVLIKPAIELTGLKGRTLQLKWSMYNADSQRLAPTDWYPQKLLFPWPSYTPKQQKDSWGSEIWLPHPVAEGNFFVRLELVEQKGGASLASADSEAFQVVLWPECAGPVPNPPYPPPGPSSP